MTHLSGEELVDALDGTLNHERMAHLDQCATCQEQHRAMSTVERELHTSSEVPEPPPFYWTRLSASIREAIADEPQARARRWFEWPVMVPGLAVAMLLVAAAMWFPSAAPPATNVVSNEIELPSPAVDEESEWELLTVLMGEAPLDEVEARTVGVPGTADHVVEQLSDAEQRELLRLLREELGTSGG